MALDNNDADAEFTDHDIPLGKTKDSELKQAINDMLIRAEEAGVPQEHMKVMTKNVMDFPDIWRVSLNNDPLLM